jgi:hypothetical protein
MMRSRFSRTGSFISNQTLSAVGLGLGDPLLGPGELVAMGREELGSGQEAVTVRHALGCGQVCCSGSPQ